MVVAPYLSGLNTIRVVTVPYWFQY